MYTCVQQTACFFPLNVCRISLHKTENSEFVTKTNLDHKYFSNYQPFLISILNQSSNNEVIVVFEPELA